jgi:hypothetical protein
VIFGKIYRVYLVSVISYGYDRQHNDKAEYLRVKTETDVDMYVSYLFNISLDFLLHVSTYNLGHHQAPYITQVIKVNFLNVDPYCATGVCCCGQILICRMRVNLYYNVIMKLFTRRYDLKFKYKNVFNYIKYLFHNICIIGVKIS